MPIDGSSRHLGEYIDKATINDLFFQRFLFTERRYNKGRTIRKLIGGGGGRSTKKNSRKGKLLNEKKFLQAN